MSYVLHLSCEEHQHFKELSTSNKLGRKNEVIFVFHVGLLQWRKEHLTRNKQEYDQVNPSLNHANKINSVVPAVESD